MSCLSYFVEPLQKDCPFSPDQPILVRTDVEESDLVKAVRDRWKPNTTLQSLAIRTYLEHLQREGITDGDETITERTLKRDLARVREWEQRANEDEKLNRGRVQGHSLSDSPI